MLLFSILSFYTLLIASNWSPVSRDVIEFANRKDVFEYLDYIDNLVDSFVLVVLLSIWLFAFRYTPDLRPLYYHQIATAIFACIVDYFIPKVLDILVDGLVPQEHPFHQLM
ncbi:Protein CBG26042 [Caenorhabditis briggsae]|uniref:Uncharacterized protein n=2 Tax=Caenorhabditis briggsae TaxID=6238 RepID=A0AAE9IS06_CAEBR|nr:Protein CBG26042 [Caenorhabditis briggsae]ULU02788.1 hypothetical protein L3Y34_002404 [Caenorhabditis briggsae]CAR99313.1 Protein CBG26042 [Caenorhabditis briggsae]